MNDLYYKNLTATYLTEKTQHEAPQRKLSAHKRNLIKLGLPLYIKSSDDENIGVIYLNGKGDIVVSYTKLKGKILETSSSAYLLDASNETINQCEPYVTYFKE